MNQINGNSSSLDCNKSVQKWPRTSAIKSSPQLWNTLYSSVMGDFGVAKFIHSTHLNKNILVGLVPGDIRATVSFTITKNGNTWGKSTVRQSAMMPQRRPCAAAGHLPADLEIASVVNIDQNGFSQLQNGQPTKAPNATYARLLHVSKFLMSKPTFNSICSGSRTNRFMKRPEITCSTLRFSPVSIMCDIF